jgi:hypothetical protein
MPSTLTARILGLLLLVVVVVTGAYDLFRLRAQRTQLVGRVQAEVRIRAETLAAAARPLLARGAWRRCRPSWIAWWPPPRSPA